ncbi:2-haloacid dehalogenase [Arthrobacter sp. CAN_A212]|uniref:haloacid dehalogenase type II n=1 Tax=unclassified Arthrobacter TaxID=235627 RepID=UPI0018CA8A73|nr:haloacid dehalogenase type II [Arthrobacter sp. CAN_C5]MBP2217617.1 2-haloacid dehalogenase [Arthrobacter sp. CAN_C5]
MTATPSVIVFDVNETLSDMGPLAEAFNRAGAPASLARLWFTEVLRDGFALTAAGNNPAFADLATDNLSRHLAQTSGQGDYQKQIEAIMGVFKNLPLHPDAAPGIKALSRITQLITLSNGATSVAEDLLERGGVQDKFSRFLSVQDAPRWKPASEAYDYAARELNQSANQLLLVAVHPWDIHGANVAGLQTAWINREGASYPSYFTPPDIEAEDLLVLADKIAAR